MSYRLKLNLLLLSLLASIAFVFFLPPVPQDPHFHHFADARTIVGISNFFDVLSNLPFVVIGLVGLRRTATSRSTNKLQPIYFVLFTGVLLTGIGSAYYHLAPANARLVYDRIPMTIVFMAVFSATISALVDRRAGRILLFPLVLIGIGSVLWWYWLETQGKGDLRPYMLVQFYPMIAIPLMFLLFYRPQLKKMIVTLTLVVAWYIAAKILERFDRDIFQLIGISGHTLKHLAAGLSTFYFLRLPEQHPAATQPARRSKTTA